MLNPECERCQSHLKPTCEAFCTLHKMMVAERGMWSAYRQSDEKIRKVVRNK
jgi:hypothetical protein